MELYKKGSKGAMVRQIQKALAGAGFRVIVDGIYGRITEEAVTSFQMREHLNVDGIVGPATLAKLFPCRWKKSKRTITDIIVHCTATPEGREVSVSEIRQWHKARGFADIGYHYVVHLHGEVEEGRDVDIIGAHCTNCNAYSIGVVYVGGVARDGKTPKDTRTLAQKAALLKLLEELKRYYPQARIHGHRDFAAKACPSFDATTEYSQLSRL